MRFIAIESSQPCCSLALFDGTSVLGSYTSPTPNTHVEEVFPTWQRLLDDATLKLTDIDALVTTLGPGTFAGTRVGIAACKSVSLATGAPVYGVTTLETLALNTDDSTVLACVDARRGQWYTQAFTNGVATGEPELLTIQQVEQSNQSIIAFDPNHTLKHASLQRGNVDATAMGRAFLAQSTPQTNLTPCYVRPPDAKVSTRATL